MDGSAAFFSFFLSAGKEKLSERKKTSSRLTHNALRCQSLPAEMKTHSEGTLYVLGRGFAWTGTSLCPPQLPAQQHSLLEAGGK